MSMTANIQDASIHQVTPDLEFLDIPIPEVLDPEEYEAMKATYARRIAKARSEKEAREVAERERQRVAEEARKAEAAKRRRKVHL